MATTLTSTVELKGNKSVVRRGTVGIALATIFTNLEGMCRVLVKNNDQTAGNSVAVGYTTSVAVASDHLVYGGTTINNEVEFFLAPGQTLYAIAAADRDVTFTATPNFSR